MDDDIKKFVFATLPEGSSKWMVVAWGKIINRQTGDYVQEIVLKRYFEKDDSTKTWDLRDFSKLAFCEVDLGSLRILSPGTIVQNQRIFQFVHEYLKKREIRIEDPKSLVKKPLRVLYGPTFPDWERLHLISSVDKAETRLFEMPHFKVLIPCDAIADYYFYGTPYLTKAILEGKLNTRFANGNDVYNPKSRTRVVSSIDTVAVTLELQRTMSYTDEFKIARLAFDNFFRSKCLDIHAGILKRNTNESYIDTDLPIEQPTTLSVYGIEVNNIREKFFLVLSISKCSAKAPFDLIFAWKKFIGKSNFLDGNEQASGVEKNENDTFSLAGATPKKNRRDRLKVKLEKGDKTNIDGKKPLWNSMPEKLAYHRDQEDNFPKDAAIHLNDFTDPKRREESEKVLRKFGFASGLATNPNKSGSGNVLQIIFSSKDPTKAKPAPPTLAFEIIENLTLLLEAHFAKRYEVTSQIRCPVQEGIDKYSAFPISELMMNVNAKLQRQYLNFCFKNVRERQHEDHRRIYICELSVHGNIFYILDLEPKYKVFNDRNEVERLVASFGVIFYTGLARLGNDHLKNILKLVASTHKTKSGKWKFLSENFGFEFLRIRHRNKQSSFEGIAEFITRFCR